MLPAFRAAALEADTTATAHQPAPCKVWGELGVLPFHTRGNKERGLSRLGCQVLVGFHFPETRGTTPCGQTPAWAAKQRRRLHSRRSCRATTKLLPALRAPAPFVSSPDLCQGGRGKTVSGRDAGRGGGGGGEREEPPCASGSVGGGGRSCSDFVCFLPETPHNGFALQPVLGGGSPEHPAQ